MIRQATRSLIAVTALVVLTAAAPDDAADAARLVDVLGVHGGSVVADIGAGDGELTVLMAKEVGPSGRVYATDLGGTPLDRLRKAIEKAGPTNVEVVEGHAVRTNLPAECCDGIF